MPEINKEAALFAAARSAVEEFGSGSGMLRLIKEERVASGIVRRQIYSVSTEDGGRYILRGYRPAFSGLNNLLSSESALWSQQHWLRFLADIEGPEFLSPLPTPGGSFLVERDVPGLDSEGAERPRLFLMQSLLPGREKNLSDLDAQDLALMGASIARLHRASRSYVPPEGFTRPTWGWEHVFGDQLRLWRYGGEDFSEAEMEVFRDVSRIAWWELKALGRGEKVFGMIHRDLQPTNFLFDEGTARIVDFDACGWGYYLYDLALLLFAVGNRHGWNSDRSRTLQRSLISGYEAEAPLPFGYERYMETFMMMRRVSRMSIVLSQTLSRGDEARPEFLSESVDRLRDFARTRDAPAESRT